MLKIPNKNVPDIRVYVWVINISVIRICFEFRVSNFGFD